MTNFINSTRISILESTRKGTSSGDSFLQMTRGRVRSFLQHTSSPTRPNEATSDADELSKIYGRHQKVTRLPHSDIKPENMIVGTFHTETRNIPAKMMSIEEATAIKNEHYHPKPLPLQSTFIRTARGQMMRDMAWYSDRGISVGVCGGPSRARSMSGTATRIGTTEGLSGLSDEDKASIEAATNILAEEIKAEEDAEASINETVEEIMKLYQDEVFTGEFSPPRRSDTRGGYKPNNDEKLRRNRCSQDEDSTGDGRDSDISTLTSDSSGGILASEGQVQDQVLDRIPPTTKTEMEELPLNMEKCRSLAYEIYHGDSNSTSPPDLDHRLFLIATDGQVDPVLEPFVVGGNIEQYLRHMGATPSQDFSIIREPTAKGNNLLYIKNAPPAVTDLVQTFYNLQKKLAKTCLNVADELKNLNINELNPRFHGIDELTRRLQIILESNQDAYEAQQGTNNTLLDLKLGNIYPGVEALQSIQRMNMEEPVHGSLNQERLLSQLGLEKLEIFSTLAWELNALFKCS